MVNTCTAAVGVTFPNVRRSCHSKHATSQTWKIPKCRAFLITLLKILVFSLFHFVASRGLWAKNYGNHTNTLQSFWEYTIQIFFTLMFHSSNANNTDWDTNSQVLNLNETEGKCFFCAALEETTQCHSRRVDAESSCRETPCSLFSLLGPPQASQQRENSTLLHTGEQIFLKRGRATRNYRRNTLWWCFSVAINISWPWKVNQRTLLWGDRANNGGVLSTLSSHTFTRCCTRSWRRASIAHQHRVAINGPLLHCYSQNQHRCETRSSLVWRSKYVHLC